MPPAPNKPSHPPIDAQVLSILSDFVQMRYNFYLHVPKKIVFFAFWISPKFKMIGPTVPFFPIPPSSYSGVSVFSQ